MVYYNLEIFCPICKEWHNYGYVDLDKGLDAVIKCNKCNNNIYVIEVKSGKIRIMFTSKGLNALGTTTGPALGTTKEQTEEERQEVIRRLKGITGGKLNARAGPGPGQTQGP